MIEIEESSGNVYADLGTPDSNEMRVKSKLAAKIGEIITEWKEKYPNLEWKAQQLRYDDILSFNQSFLNEVQSLNFKGGK